MDGKQVQQADNQPQLTVDATFSQAVEFFNAEKYIEADKLCTAIIQKAPNHIDAINLLGIIAQKVNRHDLAVEMFQKAINIDNNIALLYYNLATSLYPLGRIQEAVQVLNTALKIAPENIQIANYLN
ncbi:MAG: tetratricopeptide repeat protein [Magnetococcales bacterium]|nr:tetratricopeptide repeat protein [Magnetococcales bacterium]